jgi:hypothetical protein
VLTVEGSVVILAVLNLKTATRILFFSFLIKASNQVGQYKKVRRVNNRLPVTQPTPVGANDRQSKPISHRRVNQSDKFVIGSIDQ